MILTLNTRLDFR